jgi:ATP-dependent DNA helicase RecG
MARFKGTDKKEFLDEKRLYGNIFESLKEGELFVKRHLPVAAKIVPQQMQRIETPIIPFDAIREALLNALCHRDYSINDSSVYLAIYDDRMELYSHGGLLPGVTIEKIKKGFSKPRNRLIADVLHKCGYIETWGRGIQNIIELCEDADVPEPQFLADNLEFKVIFKFSYSIIPREIMIDSKIGALTKRQKEILNVLTSKRSLSLKEISDNLSQKPAFRTIREDLAYLKKLKFVSLEGFGRGARWSLLLTVDAKNNKAEIRRK